MIQKPLTMLRNEYASAIIETTNNSNLPAFVAVDVLKDILRELQNLAGQQYQRDVQMYNQACQAEKEQEQKDVNDDAQQSADVPTETE